MSIALLALAALLSGCSSLGYYAQAVKGHWQIVARQTSCAKLVAAPETPAELKTQLELARRLCAFAETQLGLPAHGAYRRYADLDRPYVVWNVYAAPEFSLEARTWWYPFVGSLDYRGYFSERGARNHAAELAAKGFDVYVEGVEAYSTLGWFNDPLLNTFLHHEEPVLAEILFHELAHQRLFASGDTDFNEAFATVVAKEGVRRWLRAKGADTLLDRYESALARNDEFVRIVQKARASLESIYALQSETAMPGPRRMDKERVFEQLRRDYAQLRARSESNAGYDAWFAGDLNNAKLNSVATYYSLVPAFDRLLLAQQCQLEAFYQAVEGLTRLPEAERLARLASMNEPLAAAR